MKERDRTKEVQSKDDMKLYLKSLNVRKNVNHECKLYISLV